MMGKVAAQFEVLSKRQDHMYKLKQRREGAESGGSTQDKKMLMLRNSMRRNLKVRVAISKLWHTLGELRIDGLWLNYNSYVSLHTRLSEFMGEQYDMDPDDLMDAAEEDWTEESKKAADRQVVEALAMCEDKDAPCLGYRDFFDSMFMLVDTSVGISDDPSEPPDISEESYCGFFRSIMEKVFDRTPTGWKWNGMRDGIYTRPSWKAGHALSSWDDWENFDETNWQDPMAIQRALPIPRQPADEATDESNATAEAEVEIEAVTKAKVASDGFRNILGDDGPYLELEQIAKEAKSFGAQLHQAEQFDAAQGVDAMVEHIEGAIKAKTELDELVGHALRKVYSVLRVLRSEKSEGVAAMRKQLEASVNRLGSLVSASTQLKAEEIARLRTQEAESMRMAHEAKLADGEAKRQADEAARLRAAEEEEARRLKLSAKLNQGTLVKNVELVNTWSAMSTSKAEEMDMQLAHKEKEPEGHLRSPPLPPYKRPRPLTCVEQRKDHEPVDTDDKRLGETLYLSTQTLTIPSEVQAIVHLCEVQATQGIQGEHFPHLPEEAAWIERQGIDRQHTWVEDAQMRRCTGGRPELRNGDCQTALNRIFSKTHADNIAMDTKSKYKCNRLPGLAKSRKSRSLSVNILVPPIGSLKPLKSQKTRVRRAKSTTPVCMPIQPTWILNAKARLPLDHATYPPTHPKPLHLQPLEQSHVLTPVQCQAEKCSIFEWGHMNTIAPWGHITELRTTNHKWKNDSRYLTKHLHQAKVAVYEMSD